MAGGKKLERTSLQVRVAPNTTEKLKKIAEAYHYV